MKLKNGENKINHLQMIQSVISRMGSNSFAIKGWTAAIMVAVYALIGDTKNDSNSSAILISIIPVIVMWILDTYYLVLEKKFRKLYDDVRLKNEDDIDFNMNFDSSEIYLSDLKKYCFVHNMFSISVMPFYVVCLVVTILIYLWR